MPTKKPTDVDQLQQTLVKEIEFLRREFIETVSHYQTTVEAEMVNLITHLTSKSPEEKPAVCSDFAGLRFLIELIRSSRHKKDKGRMKDLRRIHEVIKTLASRFEG
ncbi:MAG: hypothetical protein EHM72_07635 [Calditrichaeota bacterium]|nr:MAG: hypothetical protein EHM72_07635 [Calditrichota bacterium]